MNTTARVSIFLMAFILAPSIFLSAAAADAPAAQTGTIEGRVVDADTNEPLPGVNVLIVGTSQGTATGLDGRYRIEDVEPGTYDLRASFIGFRTKVIQDVVVTADQVTTVDFTMAVDVAGLEEVVVVGYGTIQKSDITGSMSSLREEDFNKNVSASLDNLLKGKVAGVRVVQSSGDPGGGSSISIRGASSISAGTGPLYVVDGVPVNTGTATAGTGSGFVAARTDRDPLASINPADIASIEVLKDASATAIYGARGANGVILITTKSGGESDLRVNYEGFAGTQRAANRLDLLTPEEYRTVLNAIIDAGGGIEEERVGEISTTTDWQDQILASNPVVQSHNISFSGSALATKFYVSLNAFLQDGIVQSSGFDRYTGRINLDHNISDQVGVGLNLSTSYTFDDYVPNGFGLNENSGAIYAAFNFDPTLPVQNDDGSYVTSPYITIENPMALVNGELSHAETYRTFGSTFGTYEVVPNLTAKLMFGFDAVNRRRDTYITRLTQDGAARGGVATILEGTQRNYLLEGTLNYDREIGEHDINALAGITTQRFTTVRASLSGEDFPSDALETNNIGLADPTNLQIGSSKFANQLLSYIGRVNYSLMDKYLFTATGRIDGSSRFGENEKFGFFPSLAVGWRLGQEDFIANTGLFSTLKLRASWGRTGNQEIGNYNSLITFGSGPTAIFNDQPVSSANPTRIANPDLKWETTEQIDIGLDFGFFDDRIYGSMDWYKKDTYDMLLQLPIPLETGFASQLTNIGSIQNTGFELELTSRNISGPFSWSTSGNLATLNNIVEDLGPVEQIITGNAGFTSQISIVEEGQPLNSYYGYEIIGIWQESDDFSQTTDNVKPGDLKYRDLNGDGSVNAEDRVILGNSIPDFTWALTNTFNYKGLDLDVMIEGVHGVDMLNNNLVDTYFPVNLRRNKFAEPYLNRWTPDNPSNVYPSFVTPLAQGQKVVNSYTVQDASYIRLQSVRLSYMLPSGMSPFRSATVYLNGDNLLTFTDYDGIDPAINPNGDPNFRIDYNAYPLARSYTLGVRIGI